MADIVEYNVFTGYGTSESKIVPDHLPAHGNGHVYVKTAPEVEPVTLAQFKEFARIDGTSEDVTLELLLSAAVGAVEDYLKKVLIERTLVLAIDWWTSPLQLPYPPLLSVVEVRTVDEDGVATVYSSDNYMVLTNSMPGLIVIKTGVTPPINTERYSGGYEVEYKAGYGKEPTDIPASIKHGILMLATYCYEYRVPVIVGTIIQEVPKLNEALGYHRRIRI